MFLEKCIPEYYHGPAIYQICLKNSKLHNPKDNKKKTF